MRPIDALKVDCRANGCRQQIPRDLLMCPAHWQMVPPDVQRAVWAAHQRGQAIGGPVAPSIAWYAAAAAAVEAVARAEGRDEGNVFRCILAAKAGEDR